MQANIKITKHVSIRTSLRYFPDKGTFQLCSDCGMTIDRSDTWEILSMNKRGMIDRQSFLQILDSRGRKVIKRNRPGRFSDDVKQVPVVVPILILDVYKDRVVRFQLTGPAQAEE